MQLQNDSPPRIAFWPRLTAVPHVVPEGPGPKIAVGGVAPFAGPIVALALASALRSPGYRNPSERLGVALGARCCFGSREICDASSPRPHATTAHIASATALMTTPFECEERKLSRRLDGSALRARARCHTSDLRVRAIRCVVGDAP